MSTLDADLIVIGSGSGGLCAGAAASRAGLKTLVLEQHYVPGGWSHNFSKNGLTFCPGVHYIGRLQPGGETRQLYEGLGLGGDLSFFKQNSSAYENCDIAGHKFSYHSDFSIFKDQLLSRYDKEKGLKEYLFILTQLMDQLPKIFEVSSFKDALTVPYRTRHIGRYGWQTLGKFLSKRIKDPVLRAILSVQCGDQGLPPSQTMMLLHAGLARHYEFGGYYPKGGGGAIARSLVKSMKTAGGKIKLGNSVEKILLEQSSSQRKVIGVKLKDGKELRAKYVISNADPEHTFRSMVGQEYLSKKLLKKISKTQYSISSLHFFVGLDTNPRNFGLDSGNLWYSRNADFDALFKKAYSEEIYHADSFEGAFISAPSLKDPSSYKGGLHAMEVVTFVSYEPFRKYEPSETEKRGNAYAAFKENIAKMFLKTMDNALPGISKHVAFYEVGTPLTNKYYIQSTGGSVYGTAKSLNQMGPFSFPAKTEIDGLYLAGASTSSHGVSGAGMSGIHAVAKILNCRWQDLLTTNGPEIQVQDAESWRPD